MSVCVVKYRSLRQADPCPEEYYTARACVSASVIWYNSNSLRLQWVDRRGQLRYKQKESCIPASRFTAVTNLNKGNSKHRRHEGRWGSGGTAPCILKIGTICTCGSFTQRPRYHQQPLKNWLGGPQNGSGSCRDEKNPLPSSEIVQPFAYLLYSLIRYGYSRFLYPSPAVAAKHPAVSAALTKKCLSQRYSKQ